VRLWRGWGVVGVGVLAQKLAFSGKPGSSEATWPVAELLWHAGGCPLTPKSAIESHLGFAESFRVHEPISTSQFAAVAALPPRNNSLRYTPPPLPAGTETWTSPEKRWVRHLQPRQFLGTATLCTRGIHRMYEGCTRDAQWICLCTSGEHPVCTPCTQHWGASSKTWDGGDTRDWPLTRLPHGSWLAGRECAAGKSGSGSVSKVDRVLPVERLGVSVRTAVPRHLRASARKSALVCSHSAPGRSPDVRRLRRFPKSWFLHPLDALFAALDAISPDELGCENLRLGDRRSSGHIG
jgi:hypothetical protein